MSTGSASGSEKPGMLAASHLTWSSEKGREAIVAVVRTAQSKENW